MYEELIESSRICATGYNCACDGCIFCEKSNDKDGDCYQQLHKATADAIEELNKKYLAAEIDNTNLTGLLAEEHAKHLWTLVTEKLPKCEQEVLICTKKKLVGRDAYIDSIVTPAIYEDGTIRENDSIWRWEDIDWAGWDEEEDCGIIPEGWWENRHFNPDGVYNNLVDEKVVAWMPLPKPYEPPKEET